jgi:hypothetical protein
MTRPQAPFSRYVKICSLLKATGSAAATHGAKYHLGDGDH